MTDTGTPRSATVSAIEPDSRPDERSLRLITILLAFACGASVANLYYAQPLLNLISHSFGVGRGTATIVVTATQLGYALGLALLLPLGDLLENRRLASRTAGRKLGLGQALEVRLEGTFGTLVMAPGEMGAGAVWMEGTQLSRKLEQGLQDLASLTAVSREAQP